MTPSKRSRILEAIAGELIEVGDKVSLVNESSVVFGDHALIAYKSWAEGHYHGIALNAAVLGEKVSLTERILQEELPPVDVLRDFIPIIYAERSSALFLISLDRCPICKRWMLRFTPRDAEWHSQMKRAGIVDVGEEIPGVEKFACEICTKEGKITFVCSLCGETRTSDLLHEDYSPDPLCEICFKTRSAEEWEVKQKEIREAHKYDYD